VDANPAFERLVGGKRETLIGKMSREVYGGDRPFSLDLFRRVAAIEETVSFDAEWPAGGSPVHIRAFSPRRGQFIAVIGVISGPTGHPPARSGQAPG